MTAYRPVLDATVVQVLQDLFYVLLHVLFYLWLLLYRPGEDCRLQSVAGRSRRRWCLGRCMAGWGASAGRRSTCRRLTLGVHRRPHQLWVSPQRTTVLGSAPDPTSRSIPCVHSHPRHDVNYLRRRMLVCPPSYGRNSRSILMKLCTVVWNQKSKIELVGSQNPTTHSPSFPQPKFSPYYCRRIAEKVVNGFWRNFLER